MNYLQLLSILLLFVISMQTQANAIGTTNSTQTCDLDLLFLLETSGTVSEHEIETLCSTVATTTNYLETTFNIRIDVSLFGMTSNLAMSESCVTALPNNHDFHLGNLADVWLASGTPQVPCYPNVDSWSAGVEIACLYGTWRDEAIRAVVPLADEPPCQGLPCEWETENATIVRTIEKVMNICSVYTVFPDQMNGEECTIPFGMSLAEETGGKFFRSKNTSNDLSNLGRYYENVIKAIASDKCGDVITPPTAPPTTSDPIPTASPTRTYPPPTEFPTEAPTEAPTTPYDIFEVSFTALGCEYESTRERSVGGTLDRGSLKCKEGSSGSYKLGDCQCETSSLEKEGRLFCGDVVYRVETTCICSCNG